MKTNWEEEGWWNDFYCNWELKVICEINTTTTSTGATTTVSTATNTNTAEGCSIGWSLFESRCYKAFGKKNWGRAESFCQDMPLVSMLPRVMGRRMRAPRKRQGGGLWSFVESVHCALSTILG